MGEIVVKVRGLALVLGAPGLFLVAFLDSSFLPLPGITDVLFVVMVTRAPTAMLLYLLITVAGSIAGCLMLYAIGKKGGQALVRKRFTGEKTDRAMAALQRNGVMAVLVPSLLPPPAPFKIFVLLAGVVGISAVRFAVAVALGRFARYFALGFLAVRYGNQAMIYMRERGAIVSLVAVAALGAGFAVYVFTAKRRGASPSGERRSLG